MTGSFLWAMHNMIPRCGKVNHIGELGNQLDEALVREAGGEEAAQAVMRRLHNDPDFALLLNACRHTVSAVVRKENE